MSNRQPSSLDPSTSPSKTSSSNERRPLYIRSDSVVNEIPRQAVRAVNVTEQENGGDEQRVRNTKLYSAGPYPTLESQVLRPRAAGTLDVTTAQVPSETIVSPSDCSQDHVSTTSPVTLDNAPISRFYDFSLNDTRESPVNHAPTSNILSSENGLTTPASTVRLVSPSIWGESDEAYETPSNTYAISASSARSLSYNDSVDWPLQETAAAFLGPTTSTPSTPTPARRSQRPTLRAVAALASEAIAHTTPSSERSINSNGTQVRRSQGDAYTEDPPRGSYLNFANRQPWQSSSEPEHPTSSPVVTRIGESPVSNATSSSPLNENFEYILSPDNRSSQFSFQRSSNGFPALRRYLEAAEASSRLPSLPSEQSSPSSENGLEARFARHDQRSDGIRWNSLMTLPTIQSQPEGTTAPSSVRLISTEPRYFLDEAETTHLTEGTEQSSIRVVSADPSNIFSEAETSALTQDTNAMSSIRLVSPEASGDALNELEASALTFQSQQSIRIVEDSPRVPGNEYRRQHSVTEETPTNIRSLPPNRFESLDAASSPVWVSYSSPVQLPHIADQSDDSASFVDEVESVDNESSPSFSLGQSHLSKSGSDSPTYSNVQDMAYPLSSDFTTTRTYRRNSIRRSSPFFHGSTSRISHKPSTVVQSSEHERYDRATTTSFHTNFSESLPKSTSVPQTPGMLENVSDLHVGPSHRQARASESLPFPAASSSVNNTPASIHMPRNRPLGHLAKAQHIRARTLGSASSYGVKDGRVSAAGSSRRSSSPAFPSDYPAPFTPQDRPVRPSNPTPGVTPARDRRTRQVFLPRLPNINNPIGTVPVSYPSVVHRSNHYQLPGRVGHRDFSPHLWHGAAQAINRRSAFRPPSVDETQVRFMTGAKARRDLQVVCFVIGFLMPVCWIVAGFLPLPERGNVKLFTSNGKSWKGKGVIGDLEKVEGFDAFTADEVAGFESARWWRGMNRCLSALGIALVTVLVVLGVITGKGGIQV